MPTPPKPSQIIQHLRSELETKLSGPGVTWTKNGVLTQFDHAVSVTAFWYADVMMEEHPRILEFQINDEVTGG